MKRCNLPVSIVALLLVSVVGCGGSAPADAAAETSGAGAAAAEPVVESAPVEEIAASIDFPAGDFTADNAARARDAASPGMAIRDALSAVGAVAGAPDQVGSGVANWLATAEDGGCLNLMLATGEGKVASVNLDTYPSGSMGAAKCQNWG